MWWWRKIIPIYAKIPYICHGKWHATQSEQLAWFQIFAGKCVIHVCLHFTVDVHWPSSVQAGEPFKMYAGLVSSMPVSIWLNILPPWCALSTLQKVRSHQFTFPLAAYVPSILAHFLIICFNFIWAVFGPWISTFIWSPCGPCDRKLIDYLECLI